MNLQTLKVVKTVLTIGGLVITGVSTLIGTKIDKIENVETIKELVKEQIEK